MSEPDLWSTPPAPRQPATAPAQQQPMAPFDPAAARPSGPPAPQFAQAPAPGGHGGPPPPRGERPTMVLLGLIFAFLVWPVGLVLSILGLREVNRTGADGRGMAKAGIIVSAVFGALSILGVLLNLFVLGAVINAAEQASETPAGTTVVEPEATTGTDTGSGDAPQVVIADGMPEDLQAQFGAFAEQSIALVAGTEGSPGAMYDPETGALGVYGADGSIAHTVTLGDLGVTAADQVTTAFVMLNEDGSLAQAYMVIGGYEASSTGPTP